MYIYPGVYYFWERKCFIIRNLLYYQVFFINPNSIQVVGNLESLFLNKIHQIK